MEISNATRMHLFYQFVIMILLFFGNGYDILLDRKIILILASVPIVCYQLIVLACCMELMPIPTWMSFLELDNKDSNTDVPEKDFELCSSPVGNGKILNSLSTEIVFPEVRETFPAMRRWEKSVMNLGATPKCYIRQQKSKSWMNLSDSRSSSSKEGSLDTIASSTDGKIFSEFLTRDNKTNRAERAEKAKSWKNSLSDFKNCEKPGSLSYSLKGDAELSPVSKKDEPEQSELEKSYSFPFRQKRLQSWLEMKESVSPQSQNLDVPYWQSVGYNLAVKYEARRRQRALLNQTKNALHNKDSNLVKSNENVPEATLVDKPISKKSSKSASARISKLKVGISNLVLKKKEEMEDNNYSNKVSKLALFKQKNKITSPLKEKEPIGMPEFPQFLNNDRPLIFYPKYLPFEKERFESDVKMKIMELAEEQKNNKQHLV